MDKGSDGQFQNRWDFRGREDDVDSSSDDSKSKSGSEAEDWRRKLLSNLVVPENIEVLATPSVQRQNKLDQNKDVSILSGKTAKKRVKPTEKMKKNPQLKKTKKSPTEEKKKKTMTPRRKTKRNPTEKKKPRRRNTNAQEKKMCEDLKLFTNSLVQELKVARENMFAHMKEEMREMVACRSSTEPRTDRSDGLLGRCHKSNVDSKTAKANELSSIMPNESNHVVSSPYLPLPTVVTKPELQSNILPSNDCIREETPQINSGSDIDIRKSMSSKNLDGFPAFHPTETQLGSCSQISCNSSGQSLSQTTTAGLRFPIPGLHQGTDTGSNVSSLTEDSILGPRVNGSFLKFLEGNPAYSRMQFNRRA